MQPAIRLLRPFPLCVVIVATSVLGCANWKDDSAGKRHGLPEIQENSKSVILAIEFLPIRTDAADHDAESSLWQWVDETLIDAAVRRRWTANGLRVGRVVNLERFRMRAETIKPNQDVVDQFLAGASIASHVSHRDHRIPMRLGRRYELPLRDPIKGQQVTLVRLGEETIGRTLNDPQYLFDLVATLGTTAGQASVRLRPEIQHGETKPEWVGSDSALRIDSRRESWSIDALDLHLQGSEGDTYLIAASHPPTGLAGQMMTGVSADQSPMQIMVLIRFEQIPGPLDEL